MARVRDLWHDSSRRKTARHPDRGGNKDAKRWLAIWLDPGKAEKSKTFTTQDAAKKYAAKMEADAERGEYVDPKAGLEKFGAVAVKHLRLRKVGASSRRRYESVYRNHVEPAFGARPVKSVRPSDISGWLEDMAGMSLSVQEAAYLVVVGTFDLAVADGMRRDNPARSKIVTRPRAGESSREVWDRARVQAVIDQHPEQYRAIPAAAAALGLRQGCVLALAAEDIDFAAGKVTIRRQLARAGSRFVFKAPKGGRERVVPLPRGLAQILQAHIKEYPPRPYTLPWMEEKDKQGRITGERTARLLFRWHGDDPRTRDRHIIASSYDQGVWKPALSRAGIIPPPVPDARGIRRHKGGDRGDGMHALRHFYSVTLQDSGVSLAGVMEFMGHSRKGKVVTVAVYGHVTEETYAQARAAVDRALFRLHSAGTVTELRQAR
jgi:integrase